MMEPMVLERSEMYGPPDYDGLWKKLIHELFEEFILFCIPELHEAIDWYKKPEFLEQEFFKEIIQDKKGKRVADQIVKVYLKDGTESWLLIHIEVQGKQDSHFAQRMFRYYYRIFDKFEQDIVAIALLTDGSSKFRPAAYHYSLFGKTITYQYNLIKLFDYEEEKLLNSINPFAIAVLAGKYANEAKYDHQKRYRFKKKLIQLILLETSHYSKEHQRFYLTALLYFINYILQLPIDLNEKLKNEIILKKEVTDMLYLDRDNPPMTFSEYEKLLKDEARREGKQQGLQEGKKEVALELLKDGMPIQQVAKYVKMSMDEIKRLVKE